jgi:hypothetical protein
VVRVQQHELVPRTADHQRHHGVVGARVHGFWGPAGRAVVGGACLALQGGRACAGARTHGPWAPQGGLLPGPWVALFEPCHGVRHTPLLLGQSASDCMRAVYCCW